MTEINNFLNGTGSDLDFENLNLFWIFVGFFFCPKILANNATKVFFYLYNPLK